MLNILSYFYKLLFKNRGQEQLTPDQIQKMLIAEAITGKEFLEYEEPITNKEKFRDDFHYGHLYNKLIELRKERMNKYKKLKGDNKYSSTVWEEASVDYYSLTNKYPDSIHNMSLGSYETIYASVIAHYKGKLHMKRVEWKGLSDIISPYEFWSSIKEHYANESKQIFNWTMEDQERLIEKFLEPYKE